MTDHQERRRFPRVPVEIAVLVELLGDQIGDQIARTQDLSAGGCLFTCPSSFPPGSVVQLLINVKGEVIEAVGRVVYSTPNDAAYDLGVEFVFIRDADRSRIEGLFATRPR
jgi:hypothetical protein